MTGVDTHTVVLAPGMGEELLQIARQQAPQEACGVLTRLGRVIALPNVAEEPQERYVADPAATLAMYRRLWVEGEQVAAVWHSHPGGQEWLSGFDVAHAAHVLQVLVVLRPDGADELLAYAVADGQAHRLALVAP